MAQTDNTVCAILCCQQIKTTYYPQHHTIKTELNRLVYIIKVIQY